MPINYEKRDCLCRRVISLDRKRFAVAYSRKRIVVVNLYIVIVLYVDSLRRILRNTKWNKCKVRYNTKMSQDHHKELNIQMKTISFLFKYTIRWWTFSRPPPRTLLFSCLLYFIIQCRIKNFWKRQTTIVYLAVPRVIILIFLSLQLYNTPYWNSCVRIHEDTYVITYDM